MVFSCRTSSGPGPDLLYEAYTGQDGKPTCTRARRVGAAAKTTLELSWVGQDVPGSSADVGSCAELEDAIATSPGSLVVATLESKDQDNQRVDNDDDDDVDETLMCAAAASAPSELSGSWTGAALASGWYAGECAGSTITHGNGHFLELDVSAVGGGSGGGGSGGCSTLSSAWSGRLTVLTGGRRVTCAGGGSGGSASALFSPRGGGGAGAAAGRCMEFARNGVGLTVSLRPPPPPPPGATLSPSPSCGGVGARGIGGVLSASSGASLNHDTLIMTLSPGDAAATAAGPSDWACSPPSPGTSSSSSSSSTLSSPPPPPPPNNLAPEVLGRWEGDVVHPQGTCAFRLALDPDGAVSGHSDCSGGVPSSSPSSSSSSSGGGGGGGGDDGWIRTLSDATKRVSCAGPGEGYVETHGGACFRFKVTHPAAPAGSGAATAARLMTLHWLSHPPAAEGLPWGGGCRAVDDALASAWSTRAYVSTATLSLSYSSSSHVSDLRRCEPKRPPRELLGMWSGREAWVPRGAGKALSCPARLSVAGTSLVTSTHGGGGGGGGVGGGGSGGGGSGCREESVAVDGGDGGGGGPVVRLTEEVFMSFPTRDGCADGVAKGLLLVYDAQAKWEYCVGYERKGRRLRLAHVSASSSSGPGPRPQVPATLCPRRGWEDATGFGGGGSGDGDGDGGSGSAAAVGSGAEFNMGGLVIVVDTLDLMDGGASGGWTCNTPAPPPPPCPGR